MDYVLIVAWLFGGTGHGYQVEFATAELCQAAASQLLREADQLAPKRIAKLATPLGTEPALLPPAKTLSATCLRKR